MSFIETVPEDRAPAAVADLYETDRATFGELPNLTRAFSLRPSVYAAWRKLIGAIKAEMDPRRYELASVAAARRLHSSYCMLAHGSILAEKFFEPEATQALAADHRDAELDSVDGAVLDPAVRAPGAASSLPAARA